MDAAAAELAAYIEKDRDRFYRIAFSYLKDPEDAKDAVHESILKALRSVHTLRKREYMQTWFYRILINESLMLLRKRDREKKVVSIEELTGPELPRFVGPDSGERLDLYDSLDRLPAELKTVVLLRFFEDMQFDEIARVTGANISTAKSRLYKALKLLKVDLEVS